MKPSEYGISELGKIATPFYFYDLDLLRETLSSCRLEAGRHGSHLHYALKANSNPRILKIICQAGYGADCVSGNEVKAAMESGFDPAAIVFAGVGKTDEELRLAISRNIQSINAESLQELEVTNEIAASLNRIATVSLRIIPDVDAHTHRYITTGLEENKFGIHPWEFDAVIEKLGTLSHLNLAGLHFHIGSQITDLGIFKSLSHRVNEINSWFLGHGHRAGIINLGGGLGVDYQDPDAHPMPDFTGYFKVFRNFIDLQGGQTLHFEPGRALVAQCGSLITRVLFIKEGAHTRFAIVDAGMNDLIRPALYQSYHRIDNLSAGAGRGPDPASKLKFEKYDVVGPICESSDCFGKAVLLPETRRGDLIAIRSAGAYGQTMASRYNLRDLAGEVYSDDF
jgi:diaminopimelate decarboxylase